MEKHNNRLHTEFIVPLALHIIPMSWALGLTFMNIRAALVLVIASLMGVPQSFAAERPAEAEAVSLINLIATPERYHGKKVHITAYITVEFENMSLCMSEHVISRKDCLWLAIGPDEIQSVGDVKRYNQMKDVWLQANHQVAVIHGTFDMEHTGHLGGWTGAIKNVTHVYARDVIINFTVDPPLIEKQHPRIEDR